MKKVLTCILVILVIFTIYYISDFAVFTICKCKKHDMWQYPFIKHSFNSEKYLSTLKFQQPKGLKYKKKPIIIYGGSIALGENLDENKNLSSYLSDATKRPVYNRAILGSFLQHAIIQIENHATDEIIKEAEYAIVIIPSRIDTWRLKVYPGAFDETYYLATDYNYPKYIGNSAEKMHLDKGNFSFLTASTIYRIIEKLIVQAQPCDSSRNLKNLRNHILKMRNELNAINPDIKLLVLVYYENLDIVKDLKDEKNIVLYSITNSFGDVHQEKYKNKNGQPSSQLWQEAVPVLVKDLKL